MTKIASKVIPPEAIPQAKQLNGELNTVSQEAEALLKSFRADMAAATSGITARFKIDTRKLVFKAGEVQERMARELCSAVGIAYNSQKRYALDAAYIEHGTAYLLIVDREEGTVTGRFSGSRPDEAPPEFDLNAYLKRGEKPSKPN